MKTKRSFAVLALGVLVLTTLSVSEVLAQRGYQTAKAPIEFSATYGSMWGGNIETIKGTLRTGTGPSLGLALDIPLHPAAALELSYTRQDGSLDLDNRSGISTLSDMSVNYWQVGVVRGLTKGKVRPFLTTGLGMTYYSPDKNTVLIEDQEYKLDSNTRFSLMIGAGFKAYFGKSEKIGIRASIKTFPTFYNTSGGLWFGTGGASVGFTGNAIWQWEGAAGLTVKFGSK